MTSLTAAYAYPFNRFLVSNLASRISQRAGVQGIVLETLVTYLFKTIPGLAVENRKLVHGGEVDVLVANFSPPGEPLRWFGDYFLVECKDTNRKVPEEQFGHFLTKLNLTKTKQGAIVSNEGLSGPSPYTYARADQKVAFSEMGIIVLDLKVSELEILTSTQGFLELLQRKYEDLRFNSA